MTVPSTLLLNFFQEATEVLRNCDPEPREGRSFPPPLSHHRARLLELQRACLERVVQEYYSGQDNANDQCSVQDVQEALSSIGKRNNNNNEEDNAAVLLQQANHELNDAARLALARLVLYEECAASSTSDEKKNRPLTATKSMERSDLLEYAALCHAAVRLPNVQQHLRDGSPLFDETPSTTTSSADGSATAPQQRLERIQRQLLKAIGFEPEHGKAELERLFYSENSNTNTDDEMHRILDQLHSNMSVALTNATLMQGDSSSLLLSDHDQGGVTRVVSVNYSETLVDSQTGRPLHSTAAPKSESIVMSSSSTTTTQQLHMAREAAALEQSLLDELKSMSDEEERAARLERARQAHNDFVQTLAELPVGPERVAYLTSLNDETQRLLATHKLWNAMMLQKKNEEEEEKCPSSCIRSGS